MGDVYDWETDGLVTFRFECRNKELTVYKSKDITTAKQVRESLDKVNVNADNAFIYAPILVEREEDEKYDFKKYMKRNWNK